MKLRGNSGKSITKEKIVENAPHLETVEEVFIHFSAFNNYYQHDSRVLYAFYSQ